MTSFFRAPTHLFSGFRPSGRDPLLPEHIGAHRVFLAYISSWIGCPGDDHARLDPQRTRKGRERPLRSPPFVSRLSFGGGASANPESSTPPASGEAGFVSRRPNEISRDEIMARGTNAHHAMGLIQRLRPAWLRSRGSNSFTAPDAMHPVVYVDEMRREGVLRALLQFPTSEIQRLAFIGPSDVTIRWGPATRQV